MAKIIGKELANIPWQEKPQDYPRPVWRYTENPIIDRYAIPTSNSIFNSAVVPFEDGFAGVFRCDSLGVSMDIYAGFSKDAIHWEINHDPIRFEGADPEILNREYRYDPRVCFIEDRYYITWCNGYHGPTIGVAYTFDFKTFVQLENAFLPYNRNGVLFPRKIDGKFAMLSRPSDTGHTPFGDIFISESKDLEYWGKHRHVMGRGSAWWESVKIGGGAAPIETSEGWLLFYHGVSGTCNGLVYSIGGAILDIDEPSKVKYRCETFLLTPEEWYEERGFVPNVTFPCATIHDAETGRIAVYYGAADSYVGLAFTTVDEVVDYIKDHSVVTTMDTEIGKR